jgi:hypothetical protein
MLLSPLHYVKKQRARRRRLRTVLHMLSASGVIRPSHIEPRYFESSSHRDVTFRSPNGTRSHSVM